VPESRRGADRAALFIMLVAIRKNWYEPRARQTLSVEELGKTLINANHDAAKRKFLIKGWRKAYRYPKEVRRGKGVPIG